ncbi:hypothetical protein HII36_37210 [Nonomuraea sp. NN258]|uniref:hypothetical protein n=1 Tax=Nonomuraea antri TaxID=2730852 RepID=UPI0015699486|nr:hypothetical protein [Nonomuraea antri]NRQ37433.1 hypothetical protein [Nonomuraea antri]
MMRRILAGAAIAGALFGLSTTAASADVPNPVNYDKNILGQDSILDDLTALNDVLNDSLKYIDILTLAHLQDMELNILNNQAQYGDNN